MREKNQMLFGMRTFGRLCLHPPPQLCASRSGPSSVHPAVPPSSSSHPAVQFPESQTFRTICVKKSLLRNQANKRPSVLSFRVFFFHGISSESRFRLARENPVHRSCLPLQSVRCEQFSKCCTQLERYPQTGKVNCSIDKIFLCCYCSSVFFFFFFFFCAIHRKIDGSCLCLWVMLLSKCPHP